MKRALFIVYACCCLFFSVDARAQYWQWARSGTCSAPLGGSEGWLTCADASDNVFLSGIYYGDSICIGNTTYYNPVNPANNVQTVIVKYDSAGNILWSHAGEHGSSRPISIAVDHKGNLYVYGYFVTDSVRFGDKLLVNPAYDQLHPGNNAVYFLLKYTDIGDLLWAASGQENFHPDGDYLKPGGIAVDASGDVYISATFNTDTFHIGTDVLLNANAADSSNDIFVAKYNTSGSLLWAKSFGGLKDDYVLDMVSNGSRVFLTGYFKSGYISFDGHRIYNSSQTGYVTCIDLNGNTVWAQSTGGKGISKCVAADRKGNVYAGGGFGDTLTFDTYSIINANGGFFLTKFDTGGAMSPPKLLKPVQPMSYCCDVSSITADNCNNVWVSVNMEVNKGIAADAATTIYPPGGSVDPVLIVGYDADGVLFDNATLPSAGGFNTGLSNSGMAADSKGFITFAGDFRVVDPFVLGPDSLHLYNGQQNNIFIAKYHPRKICEDTPPPVQPGAPNIVVYPDPARYDCVLSYTGTIVPGSAMTLRDIAGKRIRSYAVSTQYTSFSVADLPAGTYMCMVYVPGQQIYTLRLVVVH